MSNRTLPHEEFEERNKQLENKSANWQKENLLAELLNGIPEPILLIDTQGNVIFTNSISGQILETTVESLMGRNCYDFMPSHLAESRKSIIESVIRTGEKVLFEDQDNGRYFLNKISPIFIKDKIVSYLSVLSTDVTDLKTTEKALIESIEKYKTVFENSVEGILLIDDTGTIKEWNKFLESKTGCLKENTIGKKLWNIQHNLLTDDWKEKYSVQDLQTIWMNLINRLSENEIYAKEGQYIGREGSVVLTEDIVCPMILSNKKYLCIIQRDLTERRKAEQKLLINEQKLEMLNATKDKLFSIIAHDLKSHFNTIIGFSQVLKENIKENDIEKSEKYIDAINSSAKNTLHLLSNLLEWARSQTGQITFNPEIISLDPIIKDVVNMFESSAQYKSISVQIYSSSDIMVCADQNMLNIILQNFLSNAIKFTNPGGKIEIAAKSFPNGTEISVKDNGTGMDKNTIENLYSINASVPAIGTANEKGSGLGLVICREFAERHGGRIMAESEPGKGSSFSFIIPNVGDANVTNSASNIVQTSDEDDNIKLKVLIADDENHARALLEMLMKPYCKEILFAKNGAEAIELCKRYPDLDLILMDKTMPVMGGYEATQEIRQFNKDVVIFIQSAYQPAEEKENLKKTGGNDFISKPIPRDSLHNLIRKYFKYKH